MMGIFTFDECREIEGRLKANSYDRDSLLTAMPMQVLEGLPEKDVPAKQRESDIFKLNDMKAVEGVLPIERFLRNAAYASDLDTGTQAFYRERADEAVKRAKPQPVAGSLPAQAKAVADKLDAVLPEKVLWESDLLPIAFLNGALRTSLSVARIRVTRYEGGQVRKSPATGLPVAYYGTAWLIGARHIITNYHVISARSPGEAAVGAADFETQAFNSIVEFDFDDPDVPTAAYECAKLVAFDADLDFTIVELKDGAIPLNRAPLPISLTVPAIAPNNYVPVNIVQHPGGQTKQLAIRNNAAVAIEGKNLSYFTDTQPGSSGSPVCNDAWQVVALHKAATRHMGSFTYQGRDTQWINIGTPITLIVDALKASAAWNALGANAS